MTTRRPVWIDTDPTVLPGGNEVDDGLAIALAFRSPELEVIGISSVFGNGEIDRCHASAEAIVTAFGPLGMAVQRGAGQPGNFAPTPAARAIIQAAQSAPGSGLTILALGPLTNVAAALTLAPDIASRIELIIWVAGRLRGQAFRATTRQIEAFPDLNFEQDVAAARVVLASPVPMALTSWTVCSQVHLGMRDVARLSTTDDACQLLYEPVSDWLGLWKDQFGLDYFMPFDTLAVCHAMSPGRLSGFAGVGWIEHDAQPVLVAGKIAGAPVGARPLWFATGIDDAFADDLMTRMTTPVES